MKRTKLMAGLITCLFATTGMVIEATAQSWSLNGNAGTTGTNYLGTSDAKALTIKTNGAKRITITSGGKIGVGTATPGYKFDVFGGTNASDTIAVVRALVKKTGNYDIPAIEGTSQPAAGYGIGVQGNGNFIGLFGNGGVIGVAGLSSGVGVSGEVSLVGSASDLTGVQGLCSGGDLAIGVYGGGTGAVTNYGIYGDQPDTASTDYAGVFIGDVYAFRYFQASDAKLKKNITPFSGALDKVNQLSIASYQFDQAKYPDAALPGGNQIGFLADNVYEIFPGLIKQGELPAGATRDARGKVTYHSIPDVKAVNYVGLIPILAEAIKEQKQIVDQKDALIASQNDKIAQLETRFNQLASMMEQSGKISKEQLKSLQISAEKASLGQNTPNPSNGNSSISFYLPSTVKSASIEITNVQGVVLKSISLNQRGNGQATISSSEFASGNYTYSLVVDGKSVDTKTMIVTK